MEKVLNELKNEVDKNLLTLDDIESSFLKYLSSFKLNSADSSEDDSRNPYYLLTGFDGLKTEVFSLQERSEKLSEQKKEFDALVNQKITSIYNKLEQLSQVTGLKMSKHVLSSLKQMGINLPLNPNHRSRQNVNDENEEIRGSSSRNESSVEKISSVSSTSHYSSSALHKSNAKTKGKNENTVHESLNTVPSKNQQTSDRFQSFSASSSVKTKSSDKTSRKNQPVPLRTNTNHNNKFSSTTTVTTTTSKFNSSTRLVQKKLKDSDIAKKNAQNSRLTRETSKKPGWVM